MNKLKLEQYTTMSSGNDSSSTNCLGNTTLCLNGTSKVSNEDSSAATYYLSFTFIYIPGLVTNIFVLILILRDFRKAVFPAVILLLVLCCADFIALVVSFLQHTMNRYVLTITYSRCAAFAVLHPYFRLYAGFLNSFMAIDRVLALGTPFFYKSKIQMATWKIGSVIAAIIALIIGLFPIMGLGEVWIQRKAGNTIISICSTFGYFPEPWKRAYGIVYGMMGFANLFTIVVCNTLVVRIVLQLKNRIATLEQKSSDKSSSKTSFEMAFAKLMGGLAVVYIICSSPYNTLILLRQANVYVSSSTIGAIHLLGGLSYTIDPMVYILIRKTHRKRLANMIFRCKCHTEEPEETETRY